MAKDLAVDICVIGAGAGGLSVAAGASQMGAKVALVESGKMGGDCLNYGCVPSKALLAMGKVANTVRNADEFGIFIDDFRIEPSEIYNRIKKIVSLIELNDSEERFTGLGVELIRAKGQFLSPKVLQAGELTVRAKYFVIAAGSEPAVPFIAGLNNTSFLTNKTIFDLGEIPKKLIILGGGFSGVEFAQAYSKLGSEVTILECNKILSQEDPELVDILREKMIFDGINIFENITTDSIENDNEGIRVNINLDDRAMILLGSHLLICAGRTPRVNELSLQLAGVNYSSKGINVDDRLRTSNKKVFAIGDIIGKEKFTHIAAYHAGIVIKNILFHFPAKIKNKVAPRIAFTYPELAQVGLKEPLARKKFRRIRILRAPYFHNDRANIEGSTTGLIKIITNRRGVILGASILGESAGELIQIWTLAIHQRLKIGVIADMIFPYPVFGEISKRAGTDFFLPILFSERLKKIVRFFLRH